MEILRLVRTLRPGLSGTCVMACPDDYPDPRLHGRELTLAVRLREIRTETLPEADDAFAASLGLESMQRLQEEIGDVLFVCANLARYANVDVGAALRLANQKFERRFRAMEALAASDGGLVGKSLQVQDAYWEQAKHAERESLQ